MIFRIKIVAKQEIRWPFNLEVLICFLLSSLCFFLQPYNCACTWACGSDEVQDILPQLQHLGIWVILSCMNWEYGRTGRSLWPSPPHPCSLKAGINLWKVPSLNPEEGRHSCQQRWGSGSQEIHPNKQDRESQISCDITYKWKLKKDANELITSKKTHRHGKQTCYQRGKWMGKGWIRKLSLIYTYYYTKYR